MTKLLGAEHADLLATIAAGAEARRTKAAAAEHSKREDDLAQHVRRIMPDQLAAAAEVAKREAASIDTGAARAFTSWVRDREMVLPVTGTTAAGYIIDLLLTDADMHRLRQAARAISYIHEVGEWYLDQKPIRAALKFAEVVHAMAGGGDDGGGQVVPINKSPSPSSDYAEPMPLAAGAHQ